MSSDPSASVTVVIHGVGQQTRLQTLKSFIDGATASCSIPNTSTRAELARQLQHNGFVTAPHLPCVFREFNYAQLIEPHLDLAEEDPKVWVKSARHQLREINRQRGGPDQADFIALENTVDDLLFATKLGRFIAMRFHVQAEAFAAPAMHFVRQVQLYLDYPPYRDGIAAQFQALMEDTVARAPGQQPKITLVAHSLGTVVTLRAVLDAAQSRQPWLDRVERVVTFGSPIDLLLIVYPHLFTSVAGDKARGIEWRNYTLGNDPIATDLSAARHWVAQNAPGLFVADAPEEIDLGKGSLALAHTDYWHNDVMLREITPPIGAEHDASAEPATAAHVATAKRRRSNTTLFFRGMIGTAALVAWLAMVWWEENTKTHEIFAPALGGASYWQVGIWLILAAMIACHMQAWSMSRPRRVLAAFACAVFSAVAFLILPPVEFAPRPDDLLELNPFQDVDMRLHSASIVIFLVPLTALCGVIAAFDPTGRGMTKRAVGTLLVLLTFGLSLFVGSRQNVSSLSAEFGVLSLTLGLWWLGVLLGRIHHAFRRFVGGRDHLDALCRLWNMTVQFRAFRRATASLG